MTSTVLIGGSAPEHESQAATVADRAFQYGDGVFETLRIANGSVRFLESHLQRLANGCERLRIPAPDASTLRDEIERVAGATRDAVVKVIVSRGPGGRGYRAPEQPTPTRVVALYPLPAPDSGPLALRWCDTRVARQPILAGLKHLNRLEQVLAQSEWSDAGIQEGLMLDTEGELIGGTSSNVFVVRDGVLVTPDLRYCGVRGVMRKQVIDCARTLGVPVSEEPLWPEDLPGAKEVFVTNAVRGIRPVATLAELAWSDHTLARRLSAELRL
jgi:4-amino-4-deoxychorismate lyase